MCAWPWALALIGCHPAVPPVKPVDAPASIALSQQVVTDGALKHRLAAPDGAELVLLYGGEQAGRVGPCGCDQRPKGGLARSAAYAAAVRARDPNVLLLNVGNFLVDFDDGPNEIARNALIVDGLQRGGWDVWNLTAPDVAALTAWGLPPAAVSA